MRKIGILEDDAALSRELKYFLETNGYEARVFAIEEYAGKREEEVITLLMESDIRLLLLDIGLPGLDGLHLCKELCKKSEVPVIMITSMNTELTELMSMNSGADDFVAKPFSPRILLARVEAVMKRVYREGKALDSLLIEQTEEDSGRKRLFTLDLAKGRILSGERSVELTKNELQMLKLLAQKQGTIVTREELMSTLWDSCLFVDDNTLTVNMTRLKGKLESIGICRAIITKRGMGYLLL